jgi:hypothetical protein
VVRIQGGLEGRLDPPGDMPLYETAGSGVGVADTTAAALNTNRAEEGSYYI